MSHRPAVALPVARLLATERSEIAGEIARIFGRESVREERKIILAFSSDVG